LQIHDAFSLCIKKVSYRVKFGALGALKREKQQPKSKLDPFLST
jgi:hypothetical protein